MFPPGGSSPQWRYATAGAIPRSPALGSDGNIRVHSSDGFLHVVDDRGQPAFPPVPVGLPLGWASPLVDGWNNTWICRPDGGLLRVAAAGQADPRPFFRTRYRFDCSGVILGETLYIGCENHYVYAIPLTGSDGLNAWESSSALGRTGCPIHCPLAVTGGPELVVGSQDDHLYGFGLDGQKRWSVPLPGKLLSSPVVDGQGTIYAAVSQTPLNREPRGVLVAIHGVTHQFKWQYTAEAPIECSPVLGDDDVVYFGDNAGVVHAVDQRGLRVWTAQFDSPIRSAGAIIAPNRVAFGTDDGSLVVLECSSSQLAPRGWPKLLGTAAQTGCVPGP